MEDLLNSVLNIATVVFAISSMASVGFSYTVQQIIRRLRHPRLVIGALVANFIVVPAIAFAIIWLIPLGESHEIGLFLVASAAGAPFLIALANIARADVALASGILVLLLIVTIFYMPIFLPLVVPGVEVSAIAIATPLVLTMLIPLVLSLALDSIYPALGDRLQPILRNLSTISLLALIVAIAILHFEAVIGVFGSGAILAAVLFIGGALASGYLLGMTGRGTRQELALATGQRNIAATTVVATQAVGDPDTLVMVILTALAGFAILFPAARALRPDPSQASEQDVEAEKETRAHG